MKLNVEFTSHALEQFISRSDPSMTHKEAACILDKELENARWLDEHTRTGERYLYLPDIEYALIIKRDGKQLIAVTCVRQELREEMLEDVVFEEYRELPVPPSSMVENSPEEPSSQITIEPDPEPTHLRLIVDIEYRRRKQKTTPESVEKTRVKIINMYKALLRGKKPRNIGCLEITSARVVEK